MVTLSLFDTAEHETLTPEVRTVKLSDVVFDEGVYPRKEHSPQLVQRYADDLEAIEAKRNYISVAADMRLIDGRHRHLAYLTNYANEPDREIPVFIYPVTEDKDVFELAADLNSTAGWQMTAEDKRRAAIRMYSDYGTTQEDIAKYLHVRKGRVSDWLSKTLEEEKKAREEKIWGMWLACQNQDDIASTVGQTQQAISKFLQEKQLEFQGNDSSIFRNFEPQIYTTWNFPAYTGETKVFGSIPPEIVDNLLYYFTQPLDIVFDPFAGAGNTIDVCKRRARRYYVSDLSPIRARTDIRQWDITSGLPDDLPVPDFVFLDPPYWKQAEKRYSEKDTDLGNIELDVFVETIGGIARDIKRKWGQNRENARLALIIGPYQRPYTEGGTYIDLPFLCYEAIAKYLEPDIRFQVPYSTQVHTGNYVKLAKEKKIPMYLSRDLMVFKR